MADISWDCWQRPAVVIDAGSGLTKLGFAGNAQPTYTIPTVLATKEFDLKLGSSLRSGAAGLDLDCWVGEDALNNAATCTLTYPVRQGLVDNWDAMERLYQQLIYQYLRVEPEDHVFSLTEPPCNPPEAREAMAEVMFETFGAAGLHVGVQSVLALYAATSVHSGSSSSEDTGSSGSSRGRDGSSGSSSAGAGQGSMPGSSSGGGGGSSSQAGAHGAGAAPRGGSTGSTTHSSTLHGSTLQGSTSAAALTGVVVDVGEGTTSVVPIVDGYVVRAGVRSMPLGGRDVTTSVLGALRERGAGVPPEQALAVARGAKEAHGYVCAGDLNKEAARWGAEPVKLWREVVVTDPRAGNKEIRVQVGPERYTAPEMFFSPPSTSAPAPLSAASAAACTPLHQLVDGVVRGCPIDARRALYGHVVLAGGTTATRNFGRRLQAELTTLVNARLPAGSKPIDVSVLSAGRRNACHTAWLGASLLMSQCAVLASAAAGPSHQTLPGQTSAGQTSPHSYFVTSRQEYQERGPSAVRDNVVFVGL